MEVLVRIVLGVRLVAHGLVHLLWLAQSDDPAWPFRLDRSWLVSEATRKHVAVVLIALIVAGFALLGLAVWGVPGLPSIWPVLAIGAALASLAALVLSSIVSSYGAQQLTSHSLSWRCGIPPGRIASDRHTRRETFGARDGDGDVSSRRIRQSIRTPAHGSRESGAFKQLLLRGDPGAVKREPSPDGGFAGSPNPAPHVPGQQLTALLEHDPAARVCQWPRRPRAVGGSVLDGDQVFDVLVAVVLRCDNTDWCAVLGRER